MALLIVGCGTSKKSTRPAYKDPSVRVTPEKNPPREADVDISSTKVDTVEWVERPENEWPPITSPKIHTLREKTVKKDLYNVAFLAPFRAGNLVNGEAITGNYKRFIDYYTGIKLAGKALQSEGIELNVKVFDTQYSDGQTSKILNDPYLKSCDVIIGPYKRSILKEVISFGKDKKITVVSPWISSNSLAEDDPYYLQMKPSLTRHYEAIRDHILANELSSKTILLIKEGDLEKWKELGSIFSVLPDASKQGMIFSDTMFIRNDSLLPENTVFRNFLEKNKEPVFFIPYASMQDETLVYTILRKMNIDKGENEVMVYGPGTWFEYRDEVKDLLAPLNVRLSVSNLFDAGTEKHQDLLKRYYQEYGSIMSPDAAEGFDLFYFVGKALKEHGTYFQAFGETERWELNQTGFDIRPVTSGSAAGPLKIGFYENFYIQIMEYKDFQYRKIP